MFEFFLTLVTTVPSKNGIPPGPNCLTFFPAGNLPSEILESKTTKVDVNFGRVVVSLL